MKTSVFFLSLFAAGCEPSLTPRSTSRLDEVRSRAPDGYGTFIGVVREGLVEVPDRCYRTSKPVEGVRVDLGLWHAPVADYRDSVTHAIPSTLNEPRFEVITSTTTDAEGVFQFPDLPQRMTFAFRAIPRKRGPWRVSYGISLYGVVTGDIPEHLRNEILAGHPTLCLQRESP